MSRSKNLIVNADDFGRHILINRAIERAFEFGILKSATLMAGGLAFEDALRIAKKFPELGVGIHFALVNAIPVLPPHEIPTLVTKDGIFHEDYKKFLELYIIGKISHEEIRLELAAQLEKITRAGLKLTHFDSHQHLHHIPSILKIILNLTQSHKINSMRLVRTNFFDNGTTSVGRLALNFLSEFVREYVRDKKILFPEYFIGKIANGIIDEKFLCDKFQKLSDGTTELMVHIGNNNTVLQNFCHWEHDFELELNAITSNNVLNLLNEKKISLGNFSILNSKE